MANSLIVPRNWLWETPTSGEVEVVGVSFETSMPLSNLLNIDPIKRARSTSADAASSSLTVDLKDSRLMNIFGFLFSNISYSSEVRYRAFNEELPEIELLFDSISELPTGCSFSRATKGTYYDSSGYLTTAATDIPRFTHDPLTLEKRGILIENGTANSLIQSGAINSWTFQNSSYLANAAIGPKGDTEFFKIYETATSGIHAAKTTALATNISVGAASRVFSIFAKAAERSVVGIRVSPDSAASTTSSRIFLWDLANRTTAEQSVGSYFGGGGTPTMFGMEEHQNDIFRCFVGFTGAPQFSTISVEVITATNLSTVNYLGTLGSGLYVFGPQFEDISRALHSYVSTGATLVEQAPDILDYDVTGISTADTGATFMMEWQKNICQKDFNYYVLGAVTSTSTAQERFTLLGNNSASSITATMTNGTSGSTVIFTTVSSNSEWASNSRNGDPKRAVFYIKPNDFYIATEGSSVQEDVVCPTNNWSKLTIGRNPHSSGVSYPGYDFYQALDGVVKKIVIFPGVKKSYGAAETFNASENYLGVAEYDSGWIPAYPVTHPFGQQAFGIYSFGGFSPPNEIDPRGVGNFVFPDTPVLARYVRIDISDPTNPDGYIQLGIVYAAYGESPDIDIQDGYRIEPIEEATKVRSRGGTLYMDPLYKYRRFVGALSELERDRFYPIWYDMLWERGVTRPILLFVDITDSMNLFRRSIYGVMVAPSATEHQTYKYYGTVIALEEI